MTQPRYLRAEGKESRYLPWVKTPILSRAQLIQIMYIGIKTTIRQLKQ